MSTMNTRKIAKRHCESVIGHLDKAGESLTVLSEIYTESYPELHKGFETAVNTVALALQLVAQLDESI